MSEKHKGNRKQKGECFTEKTNSSKPQTIQATGLDCEGSAITAGPVRPSEWMEKHKITQEKC